MVIGWAPWWIAQTEWTSLVTQGGACRSDLVRLLTQGEPDSPLPLFRPYVCLDLQLAKVRRRLEYVDARLEVRYRRITAHSVTEIMGYMPTGWVL
jgi:hypothetical protein